MRGCTQHMHGKSYHKILLIPCRHTNVWILSSSLLQLLTTLDAIGLAIEASKTELIHFYAFRLAPSSRTLAVTHQPSLTLQWKGRAYDIKPV